MSGSGKSRGYPKKARTIFPLLCAAFLFGCTTMAEYPYDQPGAGPSPAEQAVNACNLKGHLQCIYLTARDTAADGAQLQWTRHWWRMSYIGRACERQHGRTTGLIVEGLFAIPHYTAMAIGNGLATVAYPFRREDSPEDE